MHQHLDLIVLVLLVANASFCAAVPQSVKDKAPLLFAVLDALAVNIGHAKNEGAQAKGWQTLLTTALVGAVLTLAGYKALPAEVAVAPQTVVETPVSDVADGVSLSDAVSPAQDVSAVSPTAD